MLTKFQITFGVLAGLGVLVFGIGMIAAEKQQAQPQNANVAKSPSWLAPVAWGSFGLIAASCLGVVVTLACDREKEPGSDEEDEDEAELLPVDESLPEEDEVASEMTTVEDTAAEGAELAHAEPVHTEPVHEEPAEIEFSEPGSEPTLGGEETIEFSDLPTEE